MRRNKKIAQTLFRDQNGYSPPNINIIPEKVMLKINGKDKMISITKPTYVDVKHLSNKQNHPFVQIDSIKSITWLQHFSDMILASEMDTKYLLTSHEISGFRLHIPNVGCSHVQVSRIPGSNSLFQLDYYEVNPSRYSGVSEKDSKILMILIVDIFEKDFKSINLVYTSPDLDLIDEKMSKLENALEYAHRTALIFRNIQIYMHIFASETANSPYIEITPLQVFTQKGGQLIMRRNKKIAQALLRAQGGSAPSNIRINIVPPKAIIQKNGRNKVIPIATPKYVDIKHIPKETIHPFVEIRTIEAMAWLQKFSDTILTSEKDTRYPLTNPEFDFKNPEISGFRIYVPNVGYSHIQVSRIPGTNSLFQLDYYEVGAKTFSGVNKNYIGNSKKFRVTKKWNSKKDNPKILMVVVVDISEKDFNSINLVYASSDLELMEEKMSKYDSDLEYARRAALIFRYIQVYMRNWDFNNDEMEPKCRSIEIAPLQLFGKVI